MSSSNPLPNAPTKIARGTAASPSPSYTQPRQAASPARGQSQPQRSAQGGQAARSAYGQAQPRRSTQPRQAASPARGQSQPQLSAQGGQAARSAYGQAQPRRSTQPRQAATPQRRSAAAPSRSQHTQQRSAQGGHAQPRRSAQGGHAQPRRSAQPRQAASPQRRRAATPSRSQSTQQRGAQRQPAPPRGRKKRPTPAVWVMQGFVRRLYYGLKISLKFAFVLPVLVFMVAFSYQVDRSGLFQGALAPRRIVDLMLQGYDVTNFEQMDEREVVQLFAQDVPEPPKAIGVGSSRVLQFTRENTGVDSFFNMGVTGADVRDNMTSYYKMVSYGKTPEVLLWSVDPWVFFGSDAAFDARADAELYNEFLTKVLGVETDYEEPDKVELWKALADPAYFQGNVDYYLKNRGQTTVTDDDGNAIEFNPVEGDPYAQAATIKRADGSVLYDPAFRDQTEDQIRTLAAEACMSFNSIHMEGFDAMSQTQIEAFTRFLDYAQAQGTTPILVLSPWHPYLYGYLLTEPELHQGFFQVESWLRNYCAEHNIPLYGSYDPECIEGLVEMDFFDGLHCKSSGIEKFFPGVERALQDRANGTLPDPRALTARTSLEPAEPAA